MEFGIQGVQGSFIRQAQLQVKGGGLIFLI